MTVKISELPVATEFESGDVIPIVQDGSTKQLDADGNWTFGAIDGTPIGGSTPSTGAFTSVNIDGGNIDGTPIGANSADEGNFTTLDASGDVTIADKIAHAGDTNTAIRFPSADTVTFETAGTEKVRIDSNGNVGIGTTNPAATHHVNGSQRIGNVYTIGGQTNILNGQSLLITISFENNTNFFVDLDVCGTDTGDGSTGVVKTLFKGFNFGNQIFSGATNDIWVSGFTSPSLSSPAFNKIRLTIPNSSGKNYSPSNWQIRVMSPENVISVSSSVV